MRDWARNDGHGPEAGAAEALQDAIELGDPAEIEAARKGLQAVQSMMRGQQK